ncbi:MAG: hypothetical protein ABR530_00435 [Pyrinomonadaceae bacterium]
MTNINYRSGAIDPSSCVGDAWELVKRNIGMYIGVALVSLLMISCIPIANMFLIGPVMGGFAYIVLRDMRNEPVDFGMMFKGFEKFVPLMLVGLIQSIPGIIFQILQLTVDIGRLMTNQRNDDLQFFQISQTDIASGAWIMIAIFALVFALIAMIWNVALMFAIPLTVENDIGVGEAIKLSFGAAFHNVGGLIVLVLFSILITLVGIFALCFGLLVAIPVVWAANTFAYRQVFPLMDERYNMTPPPAAYGTNFGVGQ